MSFEGPHHSRWRLVGGRSHEQQKQLRLERASHTATAVNGYIYVIAGRKGSTFYGDVLRLDTATHTWSVLFASIPTGFRPRANHTATLVGGRYIWVVAGSDNEQVFGDVHVLDVQTLTWTQPQLRGETSLLSRTAHSAELHPCDPRAIIVFAGYDGEDFNNELYVIRTDTLTVERIRPDAAGGVPPPVPRGYHSCTAIGSRCYVYGGRTDAGLVDASEMLAVYDAALNRWMGPPVTGAWPQARSSHRTVALGSRLLIHGGTAAGEQDDRLADVHTLTVCPTTGRLSWSRADEPPPATGSAAHNRPQGRSAHTVTLVGTDALYIMAGYVGSRSGQSRYTGDVYQLILGVPASEPLPALPPAPQPSPQRSPPRQPRPQDPTPHHPPKPGRLSPRLSTIGAAAAVAGGSSAGASAGAGHGASNLVHLASPRRQDPAASAADAAAPRPGKRRLGAPADAAQAPPPAAAPMQGRRGGAALAGTSSLGGGGEDDPIDLTAEPPPPAATPPKAAAAAVARRSQPAQRARAGAGDAAGGDPSAAAEGAWLGGGRRRVGGAAASHQQPPSPLPEAGGAAARAGACAARAKGPGAVGGAATGLHGHPLAAQPEGDAADGRALKRRASDAAVAAAAAAAAPPPARGRLPVQHQPATAQAGAGSAGIAASAPPASAAAAAPVAAAPASGSAPPLQQHPVLASGLAHAAMGWQAQAEMYGLPPGTIAAAATAAATAAVAATTAAGNGARPPSPPHAGLTGNSQESLMSQLFQDNQALRRQLQEAQEGERQANQNLAALQEQQRRTAEELSTQRRGCEMTQAALRTANSDLEDARSQVDHLQQELAAMRQHSAAQQQELAAARQQGSALQQQHAAAAQQAAQRERAWLQERGALLQQQAEEARRYQEQINSLEAQCGRHQAEVDKCRREHRAEVERYAEAAAALSERMGKREQDVAELTAQLREAAAQNQKLQQEQGRLQDIVQRLERDISEAREAYQRLQRTTDEQVGDLSRQRDAAQMQLTHANTRLSSLESELRRTKDDLAHSESELRRAKDDLGHRTTELAAAREQLRATQQKLEVLRQQGGLLASQYQSMQATVQAIASGT